MFIPNFVFRSEKMEKLDWAGVYIYLQAALSACWSDHAGQPMRSLGIMSHATAALIKARHAQINITVRNPNTNASLTDTSTALFVLELRPAGTCNPASRISFA